MEWKDIVLKFYRLKSHGLTFKGNKYDYAYISDKKSVGVITEIIGDNIFTIAFFPSMKNENTFIATIRFNRNTDFIIPTYESLLKFANYIVQKDFQMDKTIDLGESGILTPGKYVFHEKLAELYREYGDHLSEYDMLLLFICRWLGLEDVFN
jgi:hypothetical protein